MSAYQSQTDLYQALLLRDNKAYTYLYKQLLGTFKHWVANNSGSEMDAEDAFQKGLMNFLLNLETGKYQLQENTKITTVIFDYCKKVWINELNSKRVQSQVKIADNYDVASDANLQKDLEREETISAVRKAVEQLKKDCQSMIEWFYFEDLSLKEIAEKFGMKENSTKQKRFDCTEKLKSFYLQFFRK